MVIIVYSLWLLLLVPLRPAITVANSFLFSTVLIRVRTIISVQFLLFVIDSRRVVAVIIFHLIISLSTGFLRSHSISKVFCFPKNFLKL